MKRTYCTALLYSGLRKCSCESRNRIESAFITNFELSTITTIAAWTEAVSDSAATDRVVQCQLALDSEHLTAICYVEVSTYPLHRLLDHHWHPQVGVFHHFLEWRVFPVTLYGRCILVISVIPRNGSRTWNRG